MKYTLVFLTIMSLSFPCLASPTKGLKEILNICEFKGYSSDECDSRILQNRGGIFDLLKSHEVRLATEDDYENFVDTTPTYMNSGITVTNFRFSMDAEPSFNFHFEKLNDEVFIYQDDIYYLNLGKNNGMLILIKKDGFWRVGFDDIAITNFENSQMYKYHIANVLRRKILIYHMLRAEEKNLTRGALQDEVAYASAPLLALSNPEELKKFEKYIKSTLEETFEFYGSLNTKEDFNNKVKENL